MLVRLRNELGDIEFVFINHARNQHDTAARRAVNALAEIARETPNLHLVDGGDALPFITACDLFVTDIASTVLTAISMDKPVVLLPIEHTIGPPGRVERFQVGTFWEQIDDFRQFVDGYQTAAPLHDLLRRCVAYDDDRNCARVWALIQQRYQAWRRHFQRRQTSAGDRHC